VLFPFPTRAPGPVKLSSSMEKMASKSCACPTVTKVPPSVYETSEAELMTFVKVGAEVFLFRIVFEASS
jgi:hypothetical protein